MEMSDLIQLIRELATDVFHTLGSGHTEVAYQKAMEVGLRLQNINFEAEKVIELTYKNHYIREVYLDLLVEANSLKVIVELKATQSLGAAEKQQLRNYMQILDIASGLLINFPQAGKTKKGVHPLDPVIEHLTL